MPQIGQWFDVFGWDFQILLANCIIILFSDALVNTFCFLLVIMSQRK